MTATNNKPPQSSSATPPISTTVCTWCSKRPIADVPTELCDQCMAEIEARHLDAGELGQADAGELGQADAGGTEHVGVVIGMNGAIVDIEAIEFSRGFYSALAAGSSVAAALTAGRAQARLCGGPEFDAPTIEHAPEVDPRRLTLAELGGAGSVTCGPTPLVGLLLDLFDADELRRWFRVVTSEQLACELPSSIASPKQVADAAVSILERVDRIDAQLFASLFERRPGRRADIERIHRCYERPPESA